MGPELEEPKRFERLCYRALAEGIIGEARASRVARHLRPRTRRPARSSGGIVQWRSSFQTPRSSSTWSGERCWTTFSLPFAFAVPDLLFHRELAGPLGTDWWRLGCGSRNSLRQS